MLGHAGLDFYDLSLVDGFNLPMKIIPESGTYDPHASSDRYYCKQAVCTADLNAQCPAGLRVMQLHSYCSAFIWAAFYIHAYIYI